MATVAVDFDGVIHAYSKGWHDGTVYDEPIPGAIEALRALMQKYAVFVHTTRDPQQVGAWLYERGFDCVPDPGGFEFWNAQGGPLLITQRKLPAVAYIDDRAIRFENWTQALADLAACEPPRTGLDKVAAAVRAARGGGTPVQIRGFA